MLTLHRPENVDDRKRLKVIIGGLVRLVKKSGLRLIWPIHPRAKKQLMRYGLLPIINQEELIETIDPVGYFDFQMLQRHASLVLTDSGGLQEECSVLQVPCVTLRDNTERPETLAIGSNVLTGADEARLLKESLRMMNESHKWQHPYGDGKSGERIVEIVLERIFQGYRRESKKENLVVRNSLHRSLGVSED